MQAMLPLGLKDGVVDLLGRFKGRIRRLTPQTVGVMYLTFQSDSDRQLVANSPDIRRLHRVWKDLLLGPM